MTTSLHRGVKYAALGRSQSMTTEIDATTCLPTDDERRVAVTAAIAWAPRLIRYAARYCRSVHDAEDAYQRAMEIALIRAPVLERRQLLAWLHAVVRNEALNLSAGAHRERPADPDELARVADTTPGADRVAEWHERHRQLRDALGTLTEPERVCVALKGAGLSYAEIAERTGFTPRKVERSLVEGRDRLRRWEASMRGGGECQRLTDVISAVAHGEANSIERRRAARHVSHCGPCRAEFRRLRARQITLVALVPTGLLAQTALAAQPPDPSMATGAFERLHTASNLRLGGLWQTILEAPGPLIAKAGATLAGAAVLSAAFVSGPNQSGSEGVPAVDVAQSASIAGRPQAVRRRSLARPVSPRPVAQQAVASDPVRQSIRPRPRPHVRLVSVRVARIEDGVRTAAPVAMQRAHVVEAAVDHPPTLEFTP